MGKVTFVEPGEGRVVNGDGGKPGDVVMRYAVGGPTDLQLLEVTQRPGVVTAAHAHRQDEVIYVVDGELRFGGRTMRTGATIAIPALTLYSFRAGPNGARFVNFRAAAAPGNYISKADFLAERSAVPSDTDVASSGNGEILSTTSSARDGVEHDSVGRP